MIQQATGEQVSLTTVWKLRNGQTANPQTKLLAALADLRRASWLLLR
jgi:hypothetical protein